MITIIYKISNKRKVIKDLTHIPNKGDILVYNDEEISIRGVVCSVEHDVYNDKRGVKHDITINVY